MGRVTERSRRHSSRSSRSRRSRSRSLPSEHESSEDSQSSQSPSPPPLRQSRTRSSTSNTSKISGNSAHKRSRTIEQGSAESSSEEADEELMRRKTKIERRSVSAADQEKYQKVNGRWLSRDEYAVLVKAGFAKGEKARETCSPGRRLPENEENAAKETTLQFDLVMKDEEDNDAGREAEVEELIWNLKAPLKSFEVQATEALKSTIDAASASFEKGLESLVGHEVVELLQSWQKSESDSTKGAFNIWQEAAKHVNKRRMDGNSRLQELKDIHEEQRTALAAAKTDWEKALARHEKELEAMREEAENVKERYTAKMESATDRQKIQNEVNRKMQDVISKGLF